MSVQDIKKDLSDEARIFLLSLRAAMSEVGILIEQRSPTPYFGFAIPDSSKNGTDSWVRTYNIHHKAIDDLITLGWIERQPFGERGMPYYDGRLSEDSLHDGCFIHLVRREGYHAANFFIECSDSNSPYCQILQELYTTKSFSLVRPFKSYEVDGLNDIGLVHLSSPLPIIKLHTFIAKIRSILFRKQILTDERLTKDSVVVTLTESGERFAHSLIAQTDSRGILASG